MIENKWGKKQPWELDEIELAMRDTKRYPEENAWEYSIKYVLITIFAKLFHIRTSQSKIQQFYIDAKALCRKLTGDDTEQLQAYLRGLDQMWPKLQRQLEDPGFYKFVNKYGMDSAFLLTYFSVLSPSAPALEAAGGFSVDLGGVYRKIPESDYQAYELCVREPTFRSFCRRIWFSQMHFLNYVMETRADPDIFMAAAGLMPAFRRYELRPEMLKKVFGRIVAYDRDPKMPEYLKMVFDKPVDEYGIEYHIADLDVAFEKQELWQAFDIVDAEGLMSYYKDELETKEMLRGFKKLLRPGGIMTFDVQTMEWSMIRCAVSLAWKLPLKPDKDPRAAIERITRCATAVGLEVVEYAIDDYNKTPALVCFCLRKPV